MGRTFTSTDRADASSRTLHVLRRARSLFKKSAESAKSAMPTIRSLSWLLFGQRWNALWGPWTRPRWNHVTLLEKSITHHTLHPVWCSHGTSPVPYSFPTLLFNVIVDELESQAITVADESTHLQRASAWLLEHSSIEGVVIRRTQNPGKHLPLERQPLHNEQKNLI